MICSVVKVFFGIFHLHSSDYIPFPGLILTYILLTAIFDQHSSPTSAKTKIRVWVRRVTRSGLRCFDRFINTLGHWWVEIINYFVNRDNSGFVEGLNNKLKALKRRCYGLFNLEHLFQCIFLDLEGYRLFAG